MSALVQDPPAAAARKPRQRHAHARIRRALDNTVVTFWSTPEGLKMRLRYSRHVSTASWPDVLALGEGQLRINLV